MKALSLLQPWATLVVMGVKKIETRSWKTAYRGELLIHASKGKAGMLLAQEPPFTKHIQNFNALPFGAIIGKVVLQHVLPVEQFYFPIASFNNLTLEEKAFGDYTSGRFGWVFTDAELFKNPIPMGGTLGLWTYEGIL